MRPLVALAAACALLSACPKAPEPGGGSPPPVNRCQVDLAATGLFAQGGTGASAQVIADPSQLIGGSGATGRAGDVLLQNDKVRVVIEQPGREVGPILSGGGIVDADLARPAGEAGRDQFGKTGLIYAFGRLSSITDVEVLDDGSHGGPAIVAATGHDVQHDLINLKSLLANQAGLDVTFVVDPEKPLPVRATTYYVLSPGENRVRELTAFCNDGDVPVNLPLIELMDVGAFELFNPGSCSNGLGNQKLDVSGCVLEPSKWFATQGDGVAYGVRSYALDDNTRPVEANAALGYGGVVGVFVEGKDLNGVLSWTDPNVRTRPGSFPVRNGGQRTYLRDFVVARDIAGISSTFLDLDQATRGTVSVTATLSGAPAPGARVSVVDAANDQMVTLVVADAQGHGSVELAPGSYRLSAALEGHLVGPAASVTVAAGGTASAAVEVLPARTLSVDVKDPAGAAMPAKVTVLCAGGSCPFDASTYAQHVLLDWPQGGAAAIGYVPPTGHLSLTLPPGQYEVVVSRGPEFSTWPDTWPLGGEPVDLRQADGAVAATLGRIVDTTGWMSADLHVHAVNSTDSAVLNELRVANFLAEGVDVLLSTDHEVITDFAPYIHALDADAFMASMIGEEVTSFSHGHFNTFPLVRNPSLPNGGAFDHAGGEDGPTLRLTELFPGLKAAQPGAVVQINHPRGGSGALTLLKVDTATLKSHGDPKDFNMAPAPDATADDTRLFGDGFDALEVANGPNPSTAVLNDWMTFLSRGTVRASTGVSDTHYAYSATGGYARTWVKVGVDSPADFSPAAFADALRAHHVFAGNGPILDVSAQKVDAAGQVIGPRVEVGDTISIDAAAGEGVALTVDAQGLEWMQLDRLEVYSDAPGRDAVDGVSNSAWPDGRILDRVDLDGSAPTIEPVPGTSLHRLHVSHTFLVYPTHDTWLVGMARGLTGRSMWPLHGARPWAWSNAILVDADGSGAYDDFPLKPGQPLRPAPRAQVLNPPTPDRVEAAIRKLVVHRHE